jgi:hypothetical protein
MCLDRTGKLAFDIAIREHGEKSPKIVVEHLKQTFREENELSLHDLFERKMLPDESVLQYAIELEYLFNRIEDEDSVEVGNCNKQATLIKAFRCGIPESLLEFCRFSREPKHFMNYVNIVRHFENSWRKENDSIDAVPVDVCQVETRLNDELANSCGSDHEPQNFCCSEPSTSAELIPTPDRWSSLRRKDRISAEKPKTFTCAPFICYFCGRPNHIAANCFDRLAILNRQLNVARSEYDKFLQDTKPLVYKKARDLEMFRLSGRYSNGG